MTKPQALLADAIAIALFALFARLAHQSESMPLSFVGWLNTLWPFLLGGVIAWGVITAAKWDGVRLMPAGATAWLITAGTGLLIWSVRNGSVPHWSFILVATLSTLVLMLGWRALATAFSRRTKA